jgi:hypothetical protein
MVPYIYREGDVQHNIPRQYGWCFGCYTIVPMETLHEIPQILSDLLSQLDDGLQLLIAKSYWYRLFYTRY